jgi:hypothetical protein
MTRVAELSLLIGTGSMVRHVGAIRLAIAISSRRSVRDRPHQTDSVVLIHTLRQGRHTGRRSLLLPLTDILLVRPPERAI